ncbi:MAG: aminotransferase class III-fold pyridoxal phosphate-dependent enzyme [Anaerocolumna sp.]
MNSKYWRPLNTAVIDYAINIVKGEGVYLYDDNGKKYLDANSGLWNVNFGYSDKLIKEAMKEQIDRLPYINPITLSTSLALELSEILCEMTHEEISKVIYACSGSEAVEAAIKISRKYSNLAGRNKHHIAVIDGSYHGSFYGSMSASIYDESEKAGYGPMLDGFVKLPIPFCRCCKTEEMSEGCKHRILGKLEEELEEYKEKLCAVIMEPILASGGIIPLFKEYIMTIYNFCKKNDILFICDEVATGFGRTGTMFRFQQFDLKPDLITMSKGINNGYLPMGAICVTKKIEDIFIKNSMTLFHLSTQNSNPICLASALATIKKMKSENIMDNIKANSEYLKSVLNSELLNLNIVNEVRIYGLMAAIDLIDNKSWKPITRELLMRIVGKVYSLGCFSGMSFVEDITSSILLFPQFIASKNNMDEIVKIVKIALCEESIQMK